MILFVVLCSFIFLADGSELNKDFKISEKDIVKFTRDDAKDRPLDVVKEHVIRSLNPTNTSSEVLNKLNILQPEEHDLSGSNKFPIQKGNESKEVVQNYNLGDIPKAVDQLNDAKQEDFIESQVVDQTSDIRNTKNSDIKVYPSRVFFPPLSNAIVPFKKMTPVPISDQPVLPSTNESDPQAGNSPVPSLVNVPIRPDNNPVPTLLNVPVTSLDNKPIPRLVNVPVPHLVQQIDLDDDDDSEDHQEPEKRSNNEGSRNIFSDVDTDQSNSDLSLQTLDLVGILSLDNYFGLPSSQQNVLQDNEPNVDVPNVVLPLEPHDLNTNQARDHTFFVQQTSDEDLENISPKLSIESIDGDSFELTKDVPLVLNETNNINMGNNPITRIATGAEAEVSQQAGLNKDQQRLLLEGGPSNGGLTLPLSSVELSNERLPSGGIPLPLLNGALSNEGQATGFSLMSWGPDSTLKKEKSPTARFLPSIADEPPIFITPHGRPLTHANNQLSELDPVPFQSINHQPAHFNKPTFQTIQLEKGRVDESFDPDVLDHRFKFTSGDFPSQASSSTSSSLSPIDDGGSLLGKNPTPSVESDPNKSSSADNLSKMHPYFSVPTKESMLPPHFNDPISFLPEAGKSKASSLPNLPVQWVSQTNQPDENFQPPIDQRTKVMQEPINPNYERVPSKTTPNLSQSLSVKQLDLLQSQVDIQPYFSQSQKNIQNFSPSVPDVQPNSLQAPPDIQPYFSQSQLDIEPKLLPEPDRKIYSQLEQRGSTNMLSETSVRNEEKLSLFTESPKIIPGQLVNFSSETSEENVQSHQNILSAPTSMPNISQKDQFANTYPEQRNPQQVKVQLHHQLNFLSDPNTSIEYKEGQQLNIVSQSTESASHQSKQDQLANLVRKLNNLAGSLLHPDTRDILRPLLYNPNEARSQPGLLHETRTPIESPRYLNTLVPPTSAYNFISGMEKQLPDKKVYAMTHGVHNTERSKQNFDDDLKTTSSTVCEASVSTVFVDRFVTVTELSKILETVVQPVSTSFVTLRDHRTSTITVTVPQYGNQVTKFVDRTVFPQVPIAESPPFPPQIRTHYSPQTRTHSSYTDYFGDGTSQETFRKTRGETSPESIQKALNKYENNYLEWVKNLRDKGFHIDKHGSPRNLGSLQYGEWPKQFVIDERFWNH